MKFHVEKHGIDDESWAVVGSEGKAKMEGLTESDAWYYCKLINAQLHKDIYQDEALQAKIFDLWDQGRTIGEIIAELHLDLDETVEWLHYQGVI